MPAKKEKTEEKPKRRIFYGEQDVTAIAVDANEKKGEIVIKVLLPDGSPLTDVRNALHPKDYLVTITGPVRIVE